VEELLAEQGLGVSYETNRRWVLKFGKHPAKLSITHKFGSDYGADLDVGEAG
jgi:transposase-like protein